MNVENHVDVAERLLRERDLRRELLGVLNDGFGEPAWDMLLQLVIDDGHGRTTTIAKLIEAANCEAATARMYLGFLYSHSIFSDADFDELLKGTNEGLIVRLSGQGRERMRRYLDAAAN